VSVLELYLCQHPANRPRDDGNCRNPRLDRLAHGLGYALEAAGIRFLETDEGEGVMLLKERP
jgi:hypothetical protein